MTYLSDMQRNLFLIILIMIFSVGVLLNGFDGLWSFFGFLVIYCFFVMIPVSKNLYYENGTWDQKLILSILFILLTMDIFLSYDTIDLNGIIISLFLIVFLNYSSTTLQISPKYHPIINTFSILNIVIIILVLICLIVNIIWDLFEYHDILVSYILLMGLVISSFVHDIRFKKSFDNYSDDILKNKNLKR